jgi:hypothetical protein
VIIFISIIIDEKEINKASSLHRKILGTGLSLLDSCLRPHRDETQEIDLFEKLCLKKSDLTVFELRGFKQRTRQTASGFCII